MLPAQKGKFLAIGTNFWLAIKIETTGNNVVAAGSINRNCYQAVHGFFIKLAVIFANSDETIEMSIKRRLGESHTGACIQTFRRLARFNFVQALIIVLNKV